ncbi:hypothetical protein M413DRAFT_10443 [Hebeloma cylindrosporum]|uniref:Uncharacterized protein n=1 Tax=Hebeloma cylindrosporum TaxID=76867 RepID=A0A0C3C057_HEBCY|nr:hypothetical protein M413DRAFT_10443 [Hebeloma cylindrosporum h7]
MSEIPATSLPQTFPSVGEQHGVDSNELVDTTTDADQVDDDDNESDDNESDASDPLTDVDSAAAEDADTAPEEPYIAVELKDIPAILNNLESELDDTWNESHKGCSYNPRRNASLEHLGVVTGLPLDLGNTRKAALTYIPDLVPFLANGNVLVRQHVLTLLELLAEDEPSSHELILQCAKSMYEPMRKFEPQTDIDELKLIALIESFENAYIYSREHTRKIFVQAFAFDVTLASMLVEKHHKVRLAAQSCLTQIVEYIDEVNENVPDEDDRGMVLVYMALAYFQQMADENKEVAEAAAQFLVSDNETISQLVLAHVVDKPDVTVPLVLQLARKAANTVGAPCEFALIKFLENEDANKAVVEGFRKVWQDEDVLSQTKFGVLSGLIDSFTLIREAALKGGLCEFIIKASKEEKTAIKAMTLFDRVMDGDQSVGVALLRIEGGVDNFLDILEGPTSEARCLAAAVLARTLDSYVDSESQRPLATAALSNDNSYPRVLAALHSADPKTVNAAAKLLAEILAGEDGSKSWSYEEESGAPPPGCPLKDRTVTPDLAAYTISLLKKPDAADGALALLCQFCWGYQRGFDIVKKAFEAVVPDADVFFFAALDGEFEGRHTGRQRRVVADAAVKAGGLDRATVLLEKEHATPEARQAAVEGYRTMLCADSVDAAMGRANPKLPGILATLFAEGSLRSLKAVNFMIRLVSAEDFTKSIPSWTDFATPETVEQLTFESPDPEGLTEEEFSRLDKESAKLLAEILAGEDGSKSWSYEEESGAPPPGCPLKDRTVTPDLAAYTISLLKKPDAADGALALLCQFCWGYQRGFDIVKKAFEAVVPDADVFFFAALDGEFEGRHTGRQRRVVADAAVKAGGLDRATVLLEKEHATPEARQAAVEGYRTMLCADSVDAAMGRANPKLPGILATLFAEGSLRSLKAVNFMIRLVSAEDFTKSIPSWTDFATPETVEQLTFESPDPEGLTEEEFSRLDKECDEKTRKAEKECDTILSFVSEIITNVIPLLVPYSGQLLGPLLHRTDAGDQNSDLLKALGELATAAEADGHIGDAIVPSIKELMAKDPPPSLSNCHTWIMFGSGLATGLFLGGVLDRLFKVYDMAEDDDRFYYTDFHMPLQVIEALIGKLNNEDHVRAVQKAFWENKKAVDRALGYMRNKEEFYAAWQVSGELYAFANGYPEGIARLESENIYPNLLDVFDDAELGRPSDVGPLIGQLCHVDVEKLTDLLRSHVAGLKPPAEDSSAKEQPVSVKKKAKKGKKAKKFEPRIILTQVLERFASLVNTTPQARKALFDAQALDVAKDALSTGDDEARTYVFKVLQGFVDVPEKLYVDAVVSFLPELAMAYKNEREPLAANLELLRVLMVENLPRLIEADVHRSLVKALTDSPTGAGDMGLLINTVMDIAKADPNDGVKLLAGLFREALEAEDAFAQESNWGNSHALRRLVDEGELGANVVLEAGGLEYASRLLGSEDLQHVVKGGALSATIARSKFLQVQNKLQELGIPKAVEEGHERCLEASKKTFDAEHDGDEDEFKDKIMTRQKWSKILSAALPIIKGEIVEDYEEDFFL